MMLPGDAFVKRLLHLVGRILLWVIGLSVLAAVLFFFLRWRGYLLFPEEADPPAWPVFGVDVSSYQGDVDWPVLTGQGVDFAFIKATEGSGLQDRFFLQNWENAQAAGIRVGAYHFFSYDSPGLTQAENFISMVPVTPGMLPPVVDIEFYGDNLKDPPELEHVRSILDPLLARLEEYYGQKPILYATYRSYRLYLQSGYEAYPLWFSSPVAVPLGKDWSFWQYSHSAHLDGYRGSEGRIDLNVFRGTQEEFQRFGTR